VRHTKCSVTLLFHTLLLLQRQVQQWSTGTGITLYSLFLKLHCCNCYVTGVVTVQTWAPELLYLALAASFETKPHCVRSQMLLLWQISSITSVQQSVHTLCYRGISYCLVTVHKTCTHNTVQLHFMCGTRSYRLHIRLVSLMAINRKQEGYFSERINVVIVAYFCF
jgi:hypothetical protein